MSDAQRHRGRTFDINLLMKDAGLVAASAAATVSAAAKVLDLGKGLVRGDLIIEVTACEVASGDEIYTVGWQLSDTADFSSGIFQTAAISFGDAVPLAGDTDIGVGKYAIPVTNAFGGTCYRYARLYTTVAGTVATGINFSAFLAKQQNVG